MFLVAIIGLNGTIDSFVIARADPVNTIPKLKYYTVLTTFSDFGSSFYCCTLALGNFIFMVELLVYFLEMRLEC